MQHTWTEAGELHLWGQKKATGGRLGHGGEQNELVPSLVEALAGKKVLAEATDLNLTGLWTEAGEFLTFGHGGFGRLGHGGHTMSLCRGWWKRCQARTWSVQRLVRITQQCGPMRRSSLPLRGDKCQWGAGPRRGTVTDSLTESVPRLVDALAGKKVVKSANRHQFARRGPPGRPKSIRAALPSQPDRLLLDTVSLL